MKEKNNTKIPTGAAPVETEENRDRKIFIGLIIVFFLAIFIFNLLTPFMSDDFSYSKIVREANGFFDLIRQERQKGVNRIRNPGDSRHPRDHLRARVP